MYKRIACRAIKLQQKYRIKNYPVSLDTILEIIEDHKIKVVRRKNSSRAYLIENEMIVGTAEDRELRYQMIHEFLHSQEHCGNGLLRNPTDVAKWESQAKAFGAYFLMPIGLFENSLEEGASIYELSDQYGVQEDLVRFRIELSKGLIESKEYEALLNQLLLN